MNFVLEKIEEAIKTLEEIKNFLRTRVITESTEIDYEELKERVNVEYISKVLSAVAHKDRIKIVLELQPTGKYFTELLEATKLNNSALYFHLRVLLQAGIIFQEYSRGKYLLTDLGEQLTKMILRVALVATTVRGGEL